MRNGWRLEIKDIVRHVLVARTSVVSGLLLAARCLDWEFPGSGDMWSADGAVCRSSHEPCRALPAGQFLWHSL